MTKRTCGSCVFNRPEGSGTLVYCFGAPPTVVSVTPQEKGAAIGVQQPLLAVSFPACARHRYRWGLRGLFWRLTGGA